MEGTQRPPRSRLRGCEGVLSSIYPVSDGKFHAAPGLAAEGALHLSRPAARPSSPQDPVLNHSLLSRQGETRAGGSYLEDSPEPAWLGPGPPATGYRGSASSWATKGRGAGGSEGPGLRKWAFCPDWWWPPAPEDGPCLPAARPSSSRTARGHLETPRPLAHGGQPGLQLFFGPSHGVGSQWLGERCLSRPPGQGTALAGSGLTVARDLSAPSSPSVPPTSKAPAQRTKPVRPSTQRGLCAGRSVRPGTFHGRPRLQRLPRHLPGEPPGAGQAPLPRAPTGTQGPLPTLLTSTRTQSSTWTRAGHDDWATCQPPGLLSTGTRGHSVGLGGQGASGVTVPVPPGLRALGPSMLPTWARSALWCAHPNPGVAWTV